MRRNGSAGSKQKEAAAAAKADKIRALEEQRQAWFAQRDEVLSAASAAPPAAPAHGSRTTILPPVTRLPPDRESVSHDRGFGRSDSAAMRLPSSAPAATASAAAAGVSEDVLHKVWLVAAFLTKRFACPQSRRGRSCCAAVVGGVGCCTVCSDVCGGERVPSDVCGGGRGVMPIASVVPADRAHHSAVEV